MPAFHEIIDRAVNASKYLGSSEASVKRHSICRGHGPRRHTQVSTGSSAPNSKSYAYGDSSVKPPERTDNKSLSGMQSEPSCLLDTGCVLSKDLVPANHDVGVVDTCNLPFVEPEGKGMLPVGSCQVYATASMEISAVPEFVWMLESGNVT